MLPLEEESVRDAFTALLQPDNAPPPVSWRTFVEQTEGAPPPESDVYKFELGECEVTGPDGQAKTVDTLEHALFKCDPTAAAGISGLGFDLLRHMSPDTLRPLLRVYFGLGRWDYTRRLGVDGPAYHEDMHSYLVSVRGVALDKDGSGFERGRAVKNLRPIGVGDCLRRLAAQCQLLQLGGPIGVALARNGQYGAGFKNGTDTVYHLIAKSLDAFVAAAVAGGRGTE